MKTLHAFWLGLGLLSLSLAVVAQDESTVAPYEEYGKRLRAAEEVTPLTSTMFGDQLSLYNGATEFDVTDIDLPGNSHLPVRLSRRFVATDRRGLPGDIGGFGDWDVEVPYIDGSFVQQDGWSVIGANDSQSYARCSSQMQPYTVLADQGNIVAPVGDAWDGNHLHIPGETDEELLSNTESKLPAVADGQSYPWVTKSFYRATCASSTANGYPGESFVVVSPTGDRYIFNWALVNPKSTMLSTVPAASGKGTQQVLVRRSEIFLLATEVDDRFGNWVKYTYNGSGQLTGITANDGRAISIQWSGNYISSATAGSRTWQYAYTSNGALTYYNKTVGQLTIDPLSSVTLPDGSAWNYAIASGSMASVHSAQDTEPPPSYHCQLENNPNTGNFVYAIDAPSGAHGVFTFAYQRNYRSYVPESCTDANPDTMYPLEYAFFDNFALVSKQITGAGLTTQNWTYSYLGNPGGYVLANESFPYGVESYIPQSNTAYAAPKTVTVTDPTGITKYSFGINYGVDEGRLYTTEVDTPSGSAVRTTTNTYLADSAIDSQPFPSNAGQSIQSVAKNPMVGRLRPVTITTTAQDGDTYTHQNVAFDVFARPYQVNKYNNIPGQVALEEQTTYNDNLALWVLGQPQQVVNMETGETESQRNYDPTTALMQSQSRFGETLLSYTYNAAGQLASFTDGNNQTTSLGSYYRGIPQLINYPDNTSQQAVVDDYGDITSVTDQLGHTTNYSYNAVGWPSQISYPIGDEVTWNTKNYNFTYVTTAERGIPGGHWRRTVSTGNGTDVTYFDAMLRPLLSDTSIAGTAGSDISTANSYDWRGLTTFASYPVNGTPDLSAITVGTHKTYDTLKRLTTSQQDSELGTLTATTAYLSGAGVQATDPNGNVTTTHAQVFDEPSYDKPILVQAPAGVTQTIARDYYGNPLSITQSGIYNGTESDSVTKTLTYDSYHRLCRTTEPESGDTVMAYDGANNLQWSAAGLSITGTGCGQSQVAASAQTLFTYDPMNRAKTIAPPAGTQSTQYQYDLAGNLQWATSGNTVWHGLYNYRDMLTGESLNVVGQNALALGYAHDANGSLSVISYPNGETVSYAPDALGRPTQVGSYATGVTYYPNGQVQGFTYGNGTSYLVQQNARQLTSNFSYGNGSTLNLSEDLSYDGDSNIVSVQDLISGQRNKAFQYDGLNRLTSAVAPSLWGTESYQYDPLNNLRTRLSAGVTSVYAYDPTNRLQSITRGGSVSSFGYDPRGNLTNRNGVALLFDQKDQLSQVTGYDSYLYDANGLRVQKTSASGTPTYYFYDHGGQLMYQYAPATAQATNFIYQGTKLIARNAFQQLAAPGAVSFNANPNNGSYTVSWGAVPLATSYVLQESANGGAWVTVYAGSGASAALSGRAGGSYAYQVQGCSSSTCGGWTGSASLGVWPAAPTNPAGPGALTYAPFTVTWTASPGVATYTVQQSFNGGAWTTLASGITTPSYSVTSAPGGTYTYQVAASNAYGTSGWTATAPVSVTQVPATPTNFVMSTTNGITSMTWDAMAWATSYKMTVSGSNGGLGTYTYVVGTNSFSFPAGTYKAQQLTACSIAGCSAPLSISGQFTVGGGGAQTSAAMTKLKQVLGADSSSGSGCTATVCTVTLGGNP